MEHKNFGGNQRLQVMAPGLHPPLFLCSAGQYECGHWVGSALLMREPGYDRGPLAVIWLIVCSLSCRSRRGSAS